MIPRENSTMHLRNSIFKSYYEPWRWQNLSVEIFIYVTYRTCWFVRVATRIQNHNNQRRETVIWANYRARNIRDLSWKWYCLFSNCCWGKDCLSTWKKYCRELDPISKRTRNVGQEDWIVNVSQQALWSIRQAWECFNFQIFLNLQ